MSSNKTDIYLSGCKNDNSDKPIVIAFYIENKAIISNAVCTVKCLLYIGKAFPLAFPCPFIPFQVRYFDV